MGRLLSKIKLKYKMIALMAVFIWGFIGLSSFTFRTIQEVKVGGIMYDRIIEGHSLIADILPPPEYIIESYLTVLQIADETDKNALNGLIEKFRTLEQQYIERHEFWSEALSEGEMKKALVMDSYEPAITFYELVNDNVIPAALSGDHERARKILKEQVSAVYEKHRENIDRVVEMAEAQNIRIEKETSGLINEKNTFVIIMICVTVFLSLSMSIIVLIGIIKPLGIMKKELKTLAERGGDLTRDININSRDEIGEFALILNSFLANIRQMISQIISEFLVISDASKKVNTYMSDLNINIQNVSTITEGISSGMEEVSASTEELNATSEEIQCAIDMVAKKAQEAALSASDIMKRADSIKEDVDKSQEQAKNIYSETQIELKSAIAKSEAVEQINMLTESIMAITAQTNLLALNASIEAARAGENGRGFAVVADEIRKLAEESKSAVTKIVEVTGIVIESVKSLALYSGNLLEFVDKQVINDYSLMADTVSQYSKDAFYYNDVATELSATSQQLMASIHSISKAVGEIAAACNESAAGTSNIAKMTGDVTEQSGEVAVKSNEVSNSAEKLIELVSRFKV